MRPQIGHPKGRIIVALDVPTPKEALALVKELDGLVSFYKVGLELLMAGDMRGLLHALVKEHQVFVDLKLPSDIPETVKRTVSVAAGMGVKFLTLSNSATAGTIKAALEGRAGMPTPELLFVPFLSSLDRQDFASLYGRPPADFEKFLQDRTDAAKAAGADGFIVSGPEISLLRHKHPDVVLVSPGIRPAGSPVGDHKRTCTPAEAVRLGADYIVVGRPIRNAGSKQARRDVAKQIIDEVGSVYSSSLAEDTDGPASFRSLGDLGSSPQDSVMAGPRD